jgi:hypothetical protein
LGQLSPPLSAVHFSLTIRVKERLQRKLHCQRKTMLGGYVQLERL